MPISCEVPFDSLGNEEIDRLWAQVQGVLAGHIRDFQVYFEDSGLVLKGHVHSYYAKQLVQEAVKRATDLPIRHNDIVVR